LLPEVSSHVMIYPALAAGLACIGLLLLDTRQYPGNPLAIMRAPVALVWAIGLLVYGVNPIHFPPPAASSLGLLLGACAISLAVIPSPRGWQAPAIDSGPLVGAARAYFYLLIGVAAAVTLWDVWHVLQKTTVASLSSALMAHRLDRSSKTGAYALPGMEVAHAVAAATGALGYALWLRDRSRAGVIAASLGLASMLTSTGRWDVVAYGLWCFTLEALVHRGRSARQLLVSNLRLFALLGIFFILHGQLMGKVAGIGEAAAAPTSARPSALLNTPANLGFSGPSPAFVLHETHRCARWDAGAALANVALRRLPNVAKVLVIYFAGPFAAFDRITCEGPAIQRIVLLYWPNKIGRLLGLRPQSGTIAVDPFVDIGVGFNDFTVIYSFWCELGPALGLLAWAVTALIVRRVVRWVLNGRYGLPGLVAGAAPVTIAVRTPWVNAFFDGTLVVYFAVVLGAWWLSRKSPTPQRIVR